MSRPIARACFAATAIALSGCSADPGDPGGEDGVSEHDSAVDDVVEAGDVLRVTAAHLNLRSAPSTSSTILDVLEHDELVTCAEQSGADGWVSVTTQAGDAGWVSRKYVVEDGSGGSTETCAPSRAIGVVGTYEKALHDSIAYAEGTRGYSKDGYDVMFSFKLFESCQTHPNKCIKSGGSCSTAAGRYQFLGGTWSTVKSAKSLDSFEPENQERGAAYLIGTVRHVTVPQNRPMTASEFSNAMSKLSWEWSSLPPGRYGDPNKSMSQMRSIYCSLAGC
jgi:muramidase (phage lysozyme)